MVEIERKFLVSEDKWEPQGKGLKIIQGYLSAEPERTVRIRIAGDKSFLTIKGKPEGIKRIEFEYEIPKNEGGLLLKMSLDYPLEKIRYEEKFGGLIWEIDVFSGKNEGLILAEVELTSEDQEILIPDWVLKEVSGDIRYFNSFLALNPYSNWKNKIL